ncbi:hypothetical protein GCM10010435_41260 [Winogradskya consettensis]|uniref:Uncharacterized protein n=1 Tax=Winogradskya consettensis TaxID=113560 RepID=A0A919SSX3_9ACTN|nr:hypothetical protein [Actinoplanes consettensis]GIM76877.1 hypothetical protein Aco04nite_52620 [Actinoplanes consettensis]
MTAQRRLQESLEEFLAAAADQARLVLDAGAGLPTYDAGVEFQALAVRAMVKAPKSGPLSEVTVGLNLIWGALTDEMDAPGRGSSEQDIEAVRHMKQAAFEWLSVQDAPGDRAAYLDFWVHDECGYSRDLPELG